MGQHTKARVFMALIAVLFAVMGGVILWYFPAFRFLKGYREKLASSGPAPSRKQLEIRDANVTVHIYEPGRKADTILLIVPGLHPQGIHDPRFSFFADLIAQNGFLVVAPDISEFRDFRITGSSVDLIANLILAMPRLFPDHTRLGVLGISYGAGPAFVACAKDEIRESVDFIVSIGGYYDLSHALEFNLSGKHDAGSDRREVHPWGRLIFVLNHLEELAPPDDFDTLNESFKLRLDLKDDEAGKRELSLSESGRRFRDEILHGLTLETMNRCRAIIRRLQSNADSLSPSAYVPQLNRDLSIYLLHGRPDTSIPFEETIELTAALRKEGFRRVHSHVTDSLTHVDMSTSGIADSLKLLYWARKLLAEN